MQPGDSISWTRTFTEQDVGSFRPKELAMKAAVSQHPQAAFFLLAFPLSWLATSNGGPASCGG